MDGHRSSNVVDAEFNQNTDRLRPAVMADDPASASNVWMVVLPLISDVGQAEVRMPATDREDTGPDIPFLIAGCERSLNQVTLIIVRLRVPR